TYSASSAVLIGRRAKASCWWSRTRSARSRSPTAPMCLSSDASPWRARPTAFLPIRRCRPPTSATVVGRAASSAQFRKPERQSNDETEEKHHEREIEGRPAGRGDGGALGGRRGR